MKQTAREAIGALDPFISLQDKLKGNASPYEIPVKVVVEEDEQSVEDETQKIADNIRKKVEGTVESLRNAFKTPDEQYNEEIAAL